MITHFTNSNDGSGVTFQARYHNATSKRWELLNGRVDKADFQRRTGLRVTAVAERSTVPEWTLLDGATAVIVKDGQLRNLKLHISFTIPSEVVAPYRYLPHAVSALQRVVLDFDPDSAVASAPVQDTPTKPAVHRYRMRWRSEREPSATPMSYCTDDRGNADTVVFQQGIDVEPVTGTVWRNGSADLVTVSCFLGALATVHRWGYPYQGTPSATLYFDAGIQMKRASYCADGEAHTRAGTKIDIDDDARINSHLIAAVEAFWAPTGALCVNMANRRHPEIPFTGSCGANPQLPACPQLLPGQQFLPQYLGAGPSR